MTRIVPERTRSSQSKLVYLVSGLNGVLNSLWFALRASNMPIPALGELGRLISGTPSVAMIANTTRTFVRLTRIRCTLLHTPGFWSTKWYPTRPERNQLASKPISGRLSILILHFDAIATGPSLVNVLIAGKKPSNEKTNAEKLLEYRYAKSAKYLPQRMYHMELRCGQLAELAILPFVLNAGEKLLRRTKKL